MSVIVTPLQVITKDDVSLWPKLSAPVQVSGKPPAPPAEIATLCVSSVFRTIVSELASRACISEEMLFCTSACSSQVGVKTELLKCLQDANTSKSILKKVRITPPSRGG